MRVECVLKGLFTGGFFGLMIGGVGAVVASLSAPQPAGNTPPAAPLVTAPDVSEPEDRITVADTAPVEPQLPDDQTAQVQTPLVVAPLAEPTAPIADTRPLALPETAAIEGALSAPAVVALPDLDADAEAPVFPNPQSVAPQVPAVEDDIVISTAPAMPIIVETPVPVAEDPLVVTDATAAERVDAPASPTATVVAPDSAGPNLAEPVAVALPDLAAPVSPQTQPAGQVIADTVTAIADAPQPVATAQLETVLEPAQPDISAPVASLAEPVTGSNADATPVTPNTGAVIAGAEETGHIAQTAPRAADTGVAVVQSGSDVAVQATPTLNDVAEVTTQVPTQAVELAAPTVTVEIVTPASDEQTVGAVSVETATGPVAAADAAVVSPENAQSIAAADVAPDRLDQPTAEAVQPAEAEGSVVAAIAATDASQPDRAETPATVTANAAEVGTIAATSDVATGTALEAEAGALATAVVAEVVTPDDIAPEASGSDKVAATPTAEAATEGDVLDPTTRITALPELDAAPETQEVTTAALQDRTTARPAVVSIIDGGTSRLPQGNSGVRIRRIGSDSQEPAPAPAPAAAPVDPNAPAIARYAATFENIDGKPLLSFVILDDGRLPDPVAVVTGLPFPVTVALDPTLPGAAARMAKYRAAGIEVAIRAALPAGATPSDVEVGMAAAFDVLPETVLLVNDGQTPWGRNIADQIIANLAEDGRGFLTAAQGLNTGVRTAQSAGVPAAEVFRDLDADGQDARVIGRFLDQAAFKARQGAGIVLLARLQPTTIEALQGWSAANRAGQVAVAPVSALLAAQ